MSKRSHSEKWISSQSRNTQKTSWHCGIQGCNSQNPCSLGWKSFGSWSGIFLEKGRCYHCKIRICSTHAIRCVNDCGGSGEYYLCPKCNQENEKLGNLTIKWIGVIFLSLLGIYFTNSLIW